MSTPGLYIGSTTTYAGKNTMNIDIGLRFQKEGHNAGYMKPVGAMPIEMNGVQGDEDAFYVQDVLGITPSKAELVTPVMVTSSALDGVMPSTSCPYTASSSPCTPVMSLGTAPTGVM